MTKRVLWTMVVVSYAACSWAANGIAVSVQSNSGDRGGWGFWRGDLIRYNVTNNNVSSQETLHNKSDGYAYYPAINLAGTKVAFYRWGTPSKISVVDLASKQVTDLCDLPSPPGREHALDWMTDEWIYYVKTQGPQDPNGDPVARENVDIWRVNAVTGTNEQYIYINDGRVPMPSTITSWGATFPCYIRRLTLSLDGTRAGIQGVEWGWNCNSVFCFPPPGGNVTSDGCGYGGAGSCNISLSCSGGYCGGYMQTWHDVVEMSKLEGADGPSAIRFQLSSIESYLGEDVGQGGELIRWAQNSDKWVLQQIGWQGHAGEINNGSNQILGNWVDGEAIRTSQNSSSSGLCNCTGDFWVDGGSGNEGKYEGADGVWRTPDTPPTQSVGYREAKASSAGPRVSRIGVVNLSTGRDRAVYTSGHGEAYSLRGRRIVKSRLGNAGVVVVKDNN